MRLNPPAAVEWLRVFDDVFLGLDDLAVIRRAAGASERLLGTPLDALKNTTWMDFVQTYASEPLQDGLRYVWQAMMQGRVAPAYWPGCLAFKPGVTAGLQPVEDDPVVSLAVHLFVGVEHRLDKLIGDGALGAVERLTRLSQHLFSGAAGPLTDLQVEEMEKVLNNAQFIRQLLGDLRTELLTPTLSVPLPHRLMSLFAFSKSDFTDRRLITHRLDIHHTLSDDTVYCLGSIRDVVRRILGTLISGIAAESVIALVGDTGQEGDTIRVEIRYQSDEPGLRVTQRIKPLALSDPVRLQPMRAAERLVNSAQAHLWSVNGRAWAEPVPDKDTAARLVLVLPRWYGTG